MFMIFAYGLLALSFINANSDITETDNYLKVENVCARNTEEKKRTPIDNDDKIIKNTASVTDFYDDVEAIDTKHIKTMKSIILKRIEREILNKMNEQLNKWTEPPENDTRKDHYVVIVLVLYGLGFFTGALTARIYYLNLS